MCVFSLFFLLEFCNKNAVIHEINMAFIEKFHQTIENTIALSEIGETLVTNLTAFAEKFQPAKIGFVGDAVTCSYHKRNGRK